MSDDAATRTDRRWMRRALAVARRGWGQTAPNPLVGAVLVKDGRAIAYGWHAAWGGPHAEAMALSVAGPRARGATCYVTLEPCAHTGKTPPCADALIAAGVRRVVYAVADPNPVAAGGAARLRAAGIETRAAVEADTGRALNAPFLFAARSGTRPFVTLKLALSLDGAIAPASPGSFWLTGLPARRWVHRMRAQADAIAVGIGTVLADDPALTVRDVSPPRVAPLRVVFDRELRVPMSSQLVRTARETPVVVITHDSASSERAVALEASGVQIERVASLESGLAVLRQRGVQHVFCEGGSRLAEALLDAGTVDALAIFRTPVALGANARSAFSRSLVAGRIDTRFRVASHRRVGHDLLTVYVPAAP